MTNLTELWKKGELPEGDYYIKRRNGSTLYDNIDSSGVWRNSIDEDIVEVLAEVPSYEEYQQLLSDQLAKNEGIEINAELESRLKKTQELELELRKENEQLKELLKECKECFEFLTNDNSPWCPPEADTLLVKINKILREE